MASASACSTKWPPKFDDETSYENWKKDIEIWCELTDLATTKQALAIHLSLSGRARAASSEISIEQLKKDTGVKTLLLKLDSLFLLDKGRRQFSAFHNLYNFRRSDDMVIDKFVSEFEHVYFKFTEQNMELPDPVMAFMFLASCNLLEHEVQLVMSAIQNVTYDNMKSTVKRIFSGDISVKRHVGDGNSSRADVKVEPVFCSEVSAANETMYTRSDRPARFRGRKQFKSGSRGRGSQATSYGNSEFTSGEKPNPVGRDGKVSRCIVCDSMYHWARNCPHAGRDRDAENFETSEIVHLSLFMGYTSDGPYKSKLQTLNSESRGCAVLDTGCSTTVCGRNWLHNYLETLSEYERANIIEEVSSSSFTFGDGVTIGSQKRVILPCWIGGLRANITTDVVECDIPLLMSKDSMKKAKMILDFERDIAKIVGRKILLKCTSSGHYALPLSL